MDEIKVMAAKLMDAIDRDDNQDGMIAAIDLLSRLLCDQSRIAKALERIADIEAERFEYDRNGRS